MASLGKDVKSHFLKITLPLKRKRQHLDDEVDKDIEPPAKQASQVRMSPCCTSKEALVLEDSSPSLAASGDDTYFAALPLCDEVEATESIFPDLSDDEFSSFYGSSPSMRFLNFKSLKHTSVSPHKKFRRRKCPIPGLSWADHCDVWLKMCERDIESSRCRNQNLFQNHPGLQLRMRAILLDWLIEVCEVYKLYRETFHLTVNYIDRYLSNTKNAHKGKLQLIGITCLFIAAKVEEVYPPKIGEFAYVTDGACTAEDILEEEIVVLKTLEWSTTPLTINKWLNVYMQLISMDLANKRSPVKAAVPQSAELLKYTFIFPQYSSLDYVICGQLIDLSILDVGVNAFSNSLIAAAAIAHIFGESVAMRVSSFSHEELEPCYSWLTPFAKALEAEGAGVGARGGSLPDSGTDYSASGGGLTKICPKVNLDQSHRIQVHNICLDLFDKSQQIMEMQQMKCIESTPTTSGVVAGPSIIPPITPPNSNQKVAELLNTKTPTLAVDQ